VRLGITQRYHALQEYARIYHALAAREPKGRTLPTETWFHRLIRWILLRWRISWTLALLNRMESRRSRAMLEDFDATQPGLPRDCRRQAAAQSILHSTFIPSSG
jgi:hypothetical protein